MSWLRSMLLALMVYGVVPAFASDKPTFIVAVGAAGEPVYGERFAAWAQSWQTLAESIEAEWHQVGGGVGTSAASDRQALRGLIAEAMDRSGPNPLWVVLIGHGTFDGKQAKFNLAGPDVSEADLADWFSDGQRPLIVVNGASSSAPFLPALSAIDRVIITATRSGSQDNATYFMGHFIEALAGGDADLDKDDQVSLLEAFLLGSKRTDAFYEGEGRLAAEFALLDDNGDGLGTEAQFYEGTRPVRQPVAQRGQQPAGLDGYRAHQIHLAPSPFESIIPVALKAQRDALEREVYRLRDAAVLESANPERRAQLERKLIELAQVYAQIDQAVANME